MNRTHGQRARALGLSLTIALACGGIGTGCRPRVLYDWGQYEDSLQASYVTHDDARAWSGLEATIAAGQQAGHRIPPGACAEYGFALYRRGNREQAIEYFEREALLFPESKPLMDKLIARARADGTGSPDGERPAGEATEQ
jgi:hypothetical protein